MKKLFLAIILQILVVSFLGCGFKNNNSNINYKKQIIKKDTSKTSNAKDVPLTSSKTDKEYIEEVVNKYEKSMCDAINMNDFSLVENCIIHGSKLYVNQKKLVRDLWNQKIYEVPVSHDIVKIQLIDKEKGEYFIYTNEQIAIKYPQNDKPVVKEFSWIYTAIVDRTKGIVGLSNIEKWNK